MNLAELLRHDGVEEVSELRGTFGFMAFHGGALEERTDLIARAAAQEAQASYYGVHQPAGMRQHVPSHRFTADQSPRLAEFLAHVDIVITVHGFGRKGPVHHDAARRHQPASGCTRRAASSHC
ncbi:MAG: replication protein, partial [Actinobacteria bacterium]|nr:replication protein [Actinomycetota bacterium]